MSKYVSLSTIVVVFFVSVMQLTNGLKINNRSESEIDNLRASFKEESKVFDLLIAGEVFKCSEASELSACIKKSNKKVIIIPPGRYELKKGLRIPSNTRVIIQNGALITLADDAEMPHKGGFVIGLIGEKNKPIKNVTIIHNGVIDGNNKIHHYDRSGNEGIKVDYGESILITGTGRVQNVSGDGIDFDVSKNSIISGINVVNNSGSGVHFGSGRPITSSQNIQVIGVYASGNGYRSERYGLDVSWPNANAVSYILSHSEDNFQNWNVSGTGSKVLSSISSNGSYSDSFNGAYLYEINDKARNNFLVNLDYTVQLIRRDILRMINWGIPDYLLPLEYLRD